MGGGRRRGPPCGDKESDGARDARDMAANTMMSANAVTLAASLAGPSLARMSEHLRRPDTSPTMPPTTGSFFRRSARARWLAGTDCHAALPAPDPPSLSLSRRHRSSSSSSTNCPSSSPSRRCRSSSSSSLTSRRRRRRCRSSSSSSASRRRRSRFLLPPLGLRRGRRWMPPPLHALGNGGCAWRERETGVGPLDG